MRIRCGVRWTTKARLPASIVAHPRIFRPASGRSRTTSGRRKRNYDDNSLAVLLRREPVAKAASLPSPASGSGFFDLPSPACGGGEGGGFEPLPVRAPPLEDVPARAAAATAPPPPPPLS